jgi:hypothetical protein
LFNIYAVFVPSNQTGIGDGSPKDTVLGLYRSPKGSKRAIMVGDSGAAEDAIRMAPDTDYPILIANDDYYGGLGGRYAISTRSIRSGAIVLRHELGHNFGEVGEEYDGGYVYSGANFAYSVSDIEWNHWVEGKLGVHESKMLGQDYVWENLQSNPFRTSFKMPSDAVYSFIMQLSSVGWDTAQDVEVKVGGQKTELQGAFHDDRAFFQDGPRQLKGGTYNLEVSELVHDGNNVLGSYALYAFPLEYDFSPEKVGAYGVFRSGGGAEGYRPTHDGCLMRNMELKHLCSVDKENIWQIFLNRISLIDGVEKAGSKVILKTPKLPGLKISWYRKSSGNRFEEVKSLEGLQEWTWSPSQAGTYKVEVSFQTDEVRKYTSDFSVETLVELR